MTDVAAARPQVPDTWPWERLLLARHGQTEWNVEGRRQGQLDSALTPLGRRQARECAATAAGCGVDGVFSSPLGRARATAAIVGAACAIRPVVLAELAELHHGSWAGLSDPEVDALHPGERRVRSADRYRWAFPDGGESYADAEARAARALALVAGTGCRRPLLVAHEMLNRLLVRVVLGLAWHEVEGRRHPSGMILALEDGRESVAS